MNEILAASAATLRVSPLEIQRAGHLRNLFCHFASQQGWRTHPQLLQQLCRLTRNGLYHLLKRPPPAGLEAAALCLANARLRPQVSLHTFLAPSQVEKDGGRVPAREGVTRM